jgi:hypothetical protein
MRDRDPPLLRENVDCGAGRGGGGMRETLTSAGAVASFGGWMKDSNGNWVRCLYHMT